MTAQAAGRVTAAAVADAIRIGFIGARGGLRVEDTQKVAQLVPLLLEIDRAVKGARRAVTLVDACAGKSAVGVLASALVLKPRAVPHTIIAIEREAKRAHLCAEAARALDVVDHVQFVRADVNADDAWPQAPDVVVALHACGAASDAVIAQAIRIHARQLLVVPCCYGSAKTPHAMPWPMHGLVRKRLSQAWIDATRTAQLEAAGYHTDVVELFSPTVSPFHLLWRARYVNEPVRRQTHATLLQQLRGSSREPY